MNISAGIHGVGMVATEVAARARDRITQMIYLDASVPADGQSLLDLNEMARPRMQELSKTDSAWSYYEIDASHSPNATAPEALMALLQKIAA